MDLEEEQPVEESGGAGWMATFSDLCTLLLTFFVLLLSFANMDAAHFKDAMGSVKEAMGVQFTLHGNFESLATSVLEMSPVQSGPHINIDGLTQTATEVVKKQVEKRGLSDSVEVEGTARGVVLRARDTILFGTGSDELIGQAKPVLELIQELFAGFSGELSIQGHTDSVPIHSARFPSNWELSTARATAVMRFLTPQGGVGARRVQVAGYADTRPVAKAEDEDARVRNRRVEFLFQFPVDHDGNLKRKGVFRLNEGNGSGVTMSRGAGKHRGGRREAP